MRRLARSLTDDRGVLLFLAGALANAAWNARRTLTMRAGSRPAAWYPSVAVLVPARNEGGKIGRCVASLLAQEWDALRVLVLDDGSTDGTAGAARRAGGGDPRLAVLAGDQLPDGWTGKNWACHQLAQAAGDVDLLVFVDADTWHAPGMVAAVAEAMEREHLDMLTVVPGQELGSRWERWTVPIIPWALTTVLSPAAAQAWGVWPAAGAVGQVLAFRREAYERIGGHAVARGRVAEDLALARLAARRRLRWRVAAGYAVSRCRMYRSKEEAVAGLRKNLLASTGGGFAGLAAWAWVARAYLGPWGKLAANALRRRPGAATASAACIVLATASWAVTARRFGLGWRAIVEWPLTVAVTCGLALSSWCASWRGTATWKGRPVRQG